MPPVSPDGDQAKPGGAPHPDAAPSMSDAAVQPLRRRAHFVSGSTMRHVVVMTATSTIGLMALFLVDLVDMYFLGLLGEEEVAGAIGYGGTVIHFNISVCIGMAIAATALVSQALGAERRGRARRLATNTTLAALAVTTALAIILFAMTPWLMRLLGAGGEAHEHAVVYLRIVIISLPLLGVGVCMNGILRAAGDAKRAMYCTLAGAIVNAVLDPILIFGLDMGVAGAAVASVLARVAVVAVGLYGAVLVHDLLGPTSWRTLRRDLTTIVPIAIPATLTNVATPIGNAYVIASIAAYGTGAVAGAAIVSRLIPVAFGVVFALSGAIGPIVGQNLGARRLDRVRRAFFDALLVNAGYIIVISLTLIALEGVIVRAFNAGPDAAALVHLFCVFVSFSFMFNGALFVANAAFNNLGRPLRSTVFNWAKATLGTVPFVLAGAHIAGAGGVLLGQAAGSVVFGAIAAYFAYRLIGQLERKGGL